MGLNYKEAGVDINQEEKTIEALATALAGTTKTRKGEHQPLDIKGHYAGLINIGDKIIAMATDGVGSKLITANEMNDYTGIGIDCIAMNVNDIICTGAEPIAFVDYLAFEKPKPEQAKEIGKSIKKGAKQANITVLGGETATLPEIIRGFDIAGTCIGLADPENLVLGNEINIGDKIIGIKSSGIHSNGLTLARKTIENSEINYHTKINGQKIGKTLLTPTRIYVKEILEINKKCNITGLAHITGGGLRNLNRLGDYKYNIKNPQKPQPIFQKIQELGNITNKEMYRVFNMGTGFCITTPNPEKPLKILKKHNREAKIIGEIQEGKSIHIKGVGKL
ncbi:Phosphoribosylaminoimidazole (AIR) synthetase PurM [Methanonatronarchaeum thermophilum]|uniref:Phosphoribosylformylglycinamidine cyclo-ligase n=1 Tax=Methanonatronarchaeum thermophilum TaxID=1927129 RepID=A0A1Y3GDT3_9EURY|nr:phosphoribosylformylglycinamidine cyclo-ligase [Methanonatronarchaeum thermophilum]OUJ18473.1 Phosphoribosylaminoimidazole (AIR) synthetase PurM [Methanonatronarchaeum thermophilum]